MEGLGPQPERRRFEFQKRSQLIIRVHYESLSVSSQPFTWCRDSRLRCGWQRDRDARAQGRVERVV